MNTPLQPGRNSALVFNWFFIAGLLLLALNDHYLKQEFGNWFTGKISDFAGLFIFPMFLQFLFPRLGRISILLTGVLFVFWKLPASEYFIELYNKIAIIRITRTVDYSDFIALAVLPLSQYMIHHIDRYKINRVSPAYLSWVIVIPASLIFMATSPPVSFYMQPGGDIHIGRAYQLKITREQALTKLKAKGFNIQPDTSQHQGSRAEYYMMKSVVLDGGKDTVDYIQFGFMGRERKPLLLINNVKLKHGSAINNLKVLRKYYKRLIEADIVKDVK